MEAIASGRPRRARPGQPVHEPPAAACSCRASARRWRRRSGAAGVRVQRGHAAGRDGGLHAVRAPGRAPRARRGRPRRRGPGQRQPRRARRRRTTRRRRCASTCCRARPGAPQLVPARRGRRRRTPTATTRRSWRRRSCELYDERTVHAPPSAVAAARDADATLAQRDLVAALRAELAAIEPRAPLRPACARAGLGLAGRAGTRPIGRPWSAGSRCGSRMRRSPTEFDWDGARPTIAAWRGCAALPGARLAQPAGGRHAPRVRRRPDEDSSRLARRLAALGLPAGARMRRGRGVVTWKSTDRSSRSCAASVRSASVARARVAARDRASCTATSTGCSTPRTPTCSARRSRRRTASSRSSKRSRRRGELGRLPRTRAGRWPSARVERPEATLSELAADAGHVARRGPARPSTQLESAALHADADDRGHRMRSTCRARPVIIAGNWKMNTPPADAGALAADIAAAHRRARRRAGHLPAVRLASPPSATRSPARASRSAPRTSTPSRPAPTPARSRRRWWPASRPGRSSATRSGGATRARPTS